MFIHNIAELLKDRQGITNPHHASRFLGMTYRTILKYYSDITLYPSEAVARAMFDKGVISSMSELVSYELTPEEEEASRGDWV